MAERRPRILLASGPVGDVSPRSAAAALARGFADAAEVAVAGLAEGGRALGQALAEPDGELEALRSGWLARRPGLLAVGAERDASDHDGAAASDPLTGGSAVLGRLVAYALQGDPGRSSGGSPASVVIDLTGPDVHDAGAGLLGALGARADVALDAGPEPLAAITRLDLDAVRERLAGRELVGVVPPGQLDDQLLGLRGVTSAADVPWARRRNRCSPWTPPWSVSPGWPVPARRGRRAPERPAGWASPSSPWAAG